MLSFLAEIAESVTKEVTESEMVRFMLDQIEQMMKDRPLNEFDKRDWDL